MMDPRNERDGTDAMHAQIINYRLNGITEADYLAGSPPESSS